MKRACAVLAAVTGRGRVGLMVACLRPVAERDDYRRQAAALRAEVDELHAENARLDRENTELVWLLNAHRANQPDHAAIEAPAPASEAVPAC